MMISGGELADVVRKRYGDIDYEFGISSASTDFVSRTMTRRVINLNSGAFAGKYHLLYVSTYVSHTLLIDGWMSVMPALHPGFCMYPVFLLSSTRRL